MDLKQAVCRVIGEHNGIDLRTIMQDSRLQGQPATAVRDVIEEGVREGLIVRAPAIVAGAAGPDRFVLVEPPTAVFSDD